MKSRGRSKQEDNSLEDVVVGGEGVRVGGWVSCMPMDSLMNVVLL